MAGDDKSLSAFGTTLCPHLIRFRKLCGVLADVWGLDPNVRLEPPELSGTGEERLSSFKNFLSGMIEGRKHPWRVLLTRLGARARLSIAHSLFLFRKTLPSPKPDLEKFMDNIEKVPGDVDPGFLEFCTAEIKKIFPKGWDRVLYPSACLSSTVSTNSCAERGRIGGGCRSWVLDNEMPDISCRDDYVERCLVLSKYRGVRPSRLVAVETGGKWRKITVPSGNLSVLKPLHQSIYNQLSKQKWLLRGKESANAFRDFLSLSGEVFVSGDYESATDMLNSQVSKHCLAHILMRSRAVPPGISRMAMGSLSLPVRLRRDDGSVREVVQNSGQMMGYLLSFPLLCLINYLTFKFAVPRDVPLKINGDDIVFRSTRAEYEKWKAMVNKSGLILSVGKTMIDRRYFTLNSCLFEGRRKVVKGLPFVRSTALFPRSKDPEAVMGLSGRYRNFCPGFSGERRSRLRVWFLRLNRNLIDVTRRSLTRGLGLCVNFPELVESGLWAREAWHLALALEKPIPAPFSEWSCPPEGFKYIRVEKITKEMKPFREGLSAAWVEAAWRKNGSCKHDDWFTEMRKGTYDWGFWSASRSVAALRRARLLKLSVRNANRYLRPRRCLFNSESFKQIKVPVWVREEYQTPLMFTSGETEWVAPPRTPAVLKVDGERSVDPLIDVRDYYRPQLAVDEIFIGHDRSVTTTSEQVVGVGPNEFLLKPRGDVAVRVFARSGIGIAPPPCLL
jgi:hypothetical protein